MKARNWRHINSWKSYISGLNRVLQPVVMWITEVGYQFAASCRLVMLCLDVSFKVGVLVCVVGFARLNGIWLNFWGEHPTLAFIPISLWNHGGWFALNPLQRAREKVTLFSRQLSPHNPVYYHSCTTKSTSNDEMSNPHVTNSFITVSRQTNTQTKSQPNSSPFPLPNGVHRELPLLWWYGLCIWSL